MGDLTQIYEFFKKKNYQTKYVHFVPVWNPYRSPLISKYHIFHRRCRFPSINVHSAVTVRVNNRQYLIDPCCHTSPIPETSGWSKTCYRDEKKVFNFQANSWDYSYIPSKFLIHYFSDSSAPKVEYRFKEVFKKSDKNSKWVLNLKSIVKAITRGVLGEQFDYFGGRCQFLAFLLKHEIKLHRKNFPQIKHIRFVHIYNPNASNWKQGLFVVGTEGSNLKKGPFRKIISYKDSYGTGELKRSFSLRYHTALLIEFEDGYVILDPTTSDDFLSIEDWKKQFVIKKYSEDNRKVAFKDQPYFVGSSKKFLEIYFPAAISNYKAPMLIDNDKLFIDLDGSDWMIANILFNNGLMPIEAVQKRLAHKLFWAHKFSERQFFYASRLIEDETKQWKAHKTMKEYNNIEVNKSNQKDWEEFLAVGDLTISNYRLIKEILTKRDFANYRVYNEMNTFRLLFPVKLYFYFSKDDVIEFPLYYKYQRAYKFK